MARFKTVDPGRVEVAFRDHDVEPVIHDNTLVALRVGRLYIAAPAGAALTVLQECA